MKFIEKVKNFKKKTVAKCLGLSMAIVSAISMLAMSAFAETGASDVIDTVTTSLTEQLTSLVSKAGVAIVAVVGVGLTIFGVKWLVGVLKGFFTKLAK